MGTVHLMEVLCSTCKPTFSREAYCVFHLYCVMFAPGQTGIHFAIDDLSYVGQEMMGHGLRLDNWQNGTLAGGQQQI